MTSNMSLRFVCTNIFLLIMCATKVQCFQTTTGIAIKQHNNKGFRSNSNGNSNSNSNSNRPHTSAFLPTTIERATTAIFSSPENQGPLRRFTNPVLDDPFLPITDVSMAQIVAPALQVFWIGLVHAPSPTWLNPIFGTDVLWQTQGSLLAPTLIHGAGLACCWLLGALAAKAYEFKAIDPTIDGYGTVFATIIKAGAFATGALIFATQLDLLLEYGRWVQLGESEEIDFRLLSAAVEVANDVIFEASVLTSMRLYLAVSTARGKSS